MKAYTHTCAQAQPVTSKIPTQVWAKEQIHCSTYFKNLSTFSKTQVRLKCLYLRLWIHAAFQLIGLGYLVRIRINFIPVVSDVALVNELKRLVRN